MGISYRVASLQYFFCKIKHLKCSIFMSKHAFSIIKRNFNLKILQKMTFLIIKKYLTLHFVCVCMCMLTKVRTQRVHAESLTVEMKDFKICFNLT